MPLKKVLKKYLNRMLDSVQRSPLLSAYPTRNFGKRIDVSELSVIENKIPQELINDVIFEGKEFEIKFSYDEWPRIKQEYKDLQETDSEIPEELKKKYEKLKKIASLHASLSQKIPKESDLMSKETGSKSLWMGYPMVYVSNTPTSILAPIFLWPVSVSANLKKQGVITIKKQTDSIPIYNKAFDYWCTKNIGINPEDPEKDSLVNISKDNFEAILSGIFENFTAKVNIDIDTNLVKLPSRAYLKKNSGTCFFNSAILGIIRWENQALMNDLETLMDKDTSYPKIVENYLSGKGDIEEIKENTPTLNETEKYFVCHTDEYQEMAVLKSRKYPGVIVHGPPGTGKSETIVNIVADSLARGERVMVCCQKRAAIDVVYERMKKAGLANLATLIHDSTGDRKKVIESLKEELDASSNIFIDQDLLRTRNDLSAQIEQIEGKLDEYMVALYFKSDEIGKTYRDIRSLYVRIREKWPETIESRSYLKHLESKSKVNLEKIAHSISVLSELYFSSDPEGNPWSERKSDFNVDRFQLQDIKFNLNSLIDNIKIIKNLKFNEINFKEICLNPEESLNNLREFIDLFNQKVSSENFEILKKLCANNTYEKIGMVFDQLVEALSDSQVMNISNKYHQILYCMTLEELQSLESQLIKLKNKKTTILSFLDFKSAKNKKIIKIKLKEIFGIDERFETEVWDVLQAVSAEINCLKSRELYLKLTSMGICNTIESNEFSFYEESDELLKIKENYNYFNLLMQKLVNPAFLSYKTSILNSDFISMRKYIGQLESSLSHFETVNETFVLFDNLQNWLTKNLVIDLKEQFKQHLLEPLEEALVNYINGLDKVDMLIRYEAERKRLRESYLSIFDCLIKDYSLKIIRDKYSISQAEEYANFIKDMFFLGVYGELSKEIEEQYPILNSYDGELYDKDKEQLSNLLGKKKSIEKDYILQKWLEKRNNIKTRDWKPLLVTRGKNSKRLRQIINLGESRSLYNFKPCWITNPNTACQIFPLKEAYFDLVVFDEASQCPIEQAIPIIYRAKKIVVAGDENQLPPTGFFRSGFDIDEDNDDEAIDEQYDYTDEEKEIVRASHESALEVTDLLAASKSVLDESYLNIHYRSLHPSLIAFSNYSFYGANLKVPELGIKDNYSKTPPIVYKNIEGIYMNNTNNDEAESVVKLVKNIWKSETRPTIGVVTFNSHQQKLIDELMVTECRGDPVMSSIYENEKNRSEGNQDVSFFVKNLESVQGDERDVIIFSTTFGRDQNGVFRRNFGPLSKEGGEKRLNVAISRAKERIFVISSMPINEISDILGSSQSNPGLSLTGRPYLALYMQYVKNSYENNIKQVKQTLKQSKSLKGFSSSSTHISYDYDSEFEMQVAEALREKGFVVDTQIGESGFKVDLAIRHEKPEFGYILGVECDGATYHDGYKARLRDLWRQDILESRGWRIMRIWSTDWWKNPEFEILRIQKYVSQIYATNTTDNLLEAQVEIDSSEDIFDSQDLSTHNNTQQTDSFDLNVNGTVLKETTSSKNIKTQTTSGRAKGVTGTCSSCNESYKVRIGNCGPFLICKNCGNTSDVSREVLEKTISKDVNCPQHGVRLNIRQSRRGYFMGCPLFPKCTHTESIKIKSAFKD